MTGVSALPHCRNCWRLGKPHAGGLCHACYVWRQRHPEHPARPFPGRSGIAKVGPCGLCGAPRPHGPAAKRRHHKVYMARWAARLEQQGGV